MYAVARSANCGAFPTFVAWQAVQACGYTCSPDASRVARAPGRVKLHGMWNVLRRALTVLVVLAMPVQGFATAAMIACGPAHAAAHAAKPAAGGHAAHAGHRAAHAQAGEVAAGATDRAAGMVSDVPAALAGLADASKSDCSACASCCVAPAILVGAIEVPLARMPTEAIALRGSPEPDPVPYRIEYPPRRLLD